MCLQVFCAIVHARAQRAGVSSSVICLQRVSTNHITSKLHYILPSTCVSCAGSLRVHTLTCCTHIFLHTARAQSPLHFSCVCTYTHGSRVPKRVLCICVISLHLDFSSLMSHPSLVFLDGHFETNPFFDVHTFFPYLS